MSRHQNDNNIIWPDLPRKQKPPTKMCMWESRGAGFPQEKIYISRSSSLENNIQDAYVRALQICPTGVGLAFFLGESEQNPKVVFQGMVLPTHQQPSPN